MSVQLRPGDRFAGDDGKNYQVITIAKDAVSGQDMVVYQELFGNFVTYVKSSGSMFNEMMDTGDKGYPQTDIKPAQVSEAEKDAEKMPDSISSGEAFASAESDRAAFDKTAVDRMMEFFDTDDFEEKYKILKAMRQCRDLTDNIIDNMASTIDVVIDDGDIDERLSALIKCVGTRRKYETSRLR